MLSRVGRALLPGLPVIHFRSLECFVIRLKNNETLAEGSGLRDDVLSGIIVTEIDFIFIPASR